MIIRSKMKPQTRSRTTTDGSDQGSIVILVALGLTVFLGFGALVTDIGLLYAQKASLQNAVDAAALAGVQELPSDPSQAVQIAQDYAIRNNAQNVSIQLEANNLEISVTAQKTVPTFLAKIWGITSEQIDATAKSMMLPPNSVSGAVPLSVQNQDFQYGALYTLKTGSGTQNTGVIGGQLYGWFGPLDLTGGGAKDYETGLANNYQGTLKIGQILNVENGNMSGPTQQGVKARLDQDTRVPKNTFDNYDRNAPEIIYVPIVSYVNYDQNAVYQVQIVGFAAFFLEGVSGNGNDSMITGRFIKTLIADGKTGGTLSDLLELEQALQNGNSSEDFGVYTPKLVKN